MRAMVRHLVRDHGYQTLAYLSGRADSPDNRARAREIQAEALLAGADVQIGPAWQGDYSASGGARVVTTLLESGVPLPRAIVCANDQTALGAMHALARHGVRVPQEVAVTGFDDVPVARHLHPPLTTVRQPIHELGATAFDVLYSKISSGSRERDVVLPVRLILRESCGCVQPAAPALRPETAETAAPAEV
jgi:LacI family transcriptional regulator